MSWSDYQQLEYLGFTGTQFVELTDLPAGCKVTLVSSAADVTTSEKCAFGYRAGSSTNNSDIEVYYKGTTFYVWSRGTGYIDPTWTETIAAEQKVTANFTLLTARSKVFIGKYRASTSTSYRFKGNVYRLTLKNSDDTTFRDLFPARRVSDSVLGFYDAYNDVFFTNDGTGTFTAGPDAHSYVSSGTFEIALQSIRSVTNAVESLISWNETTPTGTTVTVEAKLDGGTYTAVTNGGALPISSGADLSSRTLYIKVSLATQTSSATPELKNLHIQIGDVSRYKSVDLYFPSGNVNDFQNAVGDITVDYDGEGSLEGAGGAVEAFSEDFTPTGLVAKWNPADNEHLEMSVAASGSLSHVDWHYFQENEHLEMSIAAVGVLTHVNDL